MAEADPGAKRPDIEPRNIHFEFDEALPVDWHSGEPGITHFYDALSLTFPDGERFFIDSVRRHAHRITDPDLQARVKAFVAQESIHSREHAHYNDLLTKHGLDVSGLQQIIRRATNFAERWLPAKTQLAATAAYEHYTALFAEALLGDPRILEGAHPLYRDLWRWHAMEEEEHKSVAFDVYQTVAPGFIGYLRRVSVMSIATFDFMFTIPLLQAILMAKHGKLFDMRAWGTAFRHLWVSPGIWRRVMSGIAAYMSPDFHPDKRRVKPEVLAWRNHYLATRSREPQGPTIFSEG